MKIRSGSNGGNQRRRNPSFRRNPAYQKAVAANLPMKALARQLGYVSMSSFYAAMRFDKMPESDKLAKIGRFLEISQGEVYELWAREMARKDRLGRTEEAQAS